MGMQCPPTPEPGSKLVKPKGFVEAALITWLIGILISSQIILIH